MGKSTFFQAERGIGREFRCRMKWIIMEANRTPATAQVLPHNDNQQEGFL